MTAGSPAAAGFLHCSCVMEPALRSGSAGSCGRPRSSTTSTRARATTFLATQMQRSTRFVGAHSSWRRRRCAAARTAWSNVCSHLFNGQGSRISVCCGGQTAPAALTNMLFLCCGVVCCAAVCLPHAAHGECHGQGGHPTRAARRCVCDSGGRAAPRQRQLCGGQGVGQQRSRTRLSTGTPAGSRWGTPGRLAVARACSASCWSTRSCLCSMTGSLTSGQIALPG